MEEKELENINNQEDNDEIINEDHNEVDERDKYLNKYKDYYLPDLTTKTMESEYKQRELFYIINNDTLESSSKENISEMKKEEETASMQKKPRTELKKYSISSKMMLKIRQII